MTTTKIALPEVGSRLDNGCWVLDAKRRASDLGVVLAFHSGADAAMPFATWHVNEEGQTFWGHYFETIGEAYADFTHRIIERG